MNNTFVLVSEQLPNDGGFHPARFLKQANERLKRIGKHGKRAMLKSQGKYLLLQFSFEGKQHHAGCKCQMSEKGIREAEQLAELVTLQLTANQFTWEWLDGLLGKTKTKEVSHKTCKELIDEYKRHWFKEKKNHKDVAYYWHNYNYPLIKVMEFCDENYSDNIAKKVIELSQNNSAQRGRTINALINFCQFFQLDTSLIEQYKRKNKIKPKTKNVPNDAEIKRIYETGFKIKTARKSHHYRYAQWQFLYGLLAVYGLRIHEAWNIANWDKPVFFDRGDWVIVQVGENEGEDVLVPYQGERMIVPAILDPNNENHVLCIHHNTKTGYRMVMPLSPNRENWIEAFNLKQPLNLPDIPNPLGRSGGGKCSYNCAIDTCKWFSLHKYNFTPHALRHAYNHRGHQLGINITVLSQSLGHSIQMNSTTYLRTMPESRKLEGLKSAIDSQFKGQSALEKAIAENELLKSKIEALKNENELLKFQIQLLKQEKSPI